MNHGRVGIGEPLVLIHGIGMSWQAWRPVLPLLALHFDVIAADSPGFGSSAPLPPGARADVPAYADRYVEWFEQLGLERPHVAGNSMGGGIALELARRGAVRSATALSPVGFWSAAERRWCQAVVRAFYETPAVVRPAAMRALDSGVGRAAVLGLLYRWPSRVTAEAARESTRILWGAEGLPRARRAFADYTYEAGPMPIAVPTTIAWGDRDVLLLHPTQSRRARRRVPEAEHRTLHAGHLPMWDDPAGVSAAISATAARASG